MQQQILNRVKMIAVLIAIPLVLTTWVGCAKKTTTTATSAEAANAVPGTEGTRLLRFNNWNEPEYLDPGLMSGTYESNIIRNVFEGLVQNNHQTGEAEPAGATHWEISKDLKTYTFHLRKDVQWTDGRPVTAKDYVYAWERVLNPSTGAKYAFALYHVKNAEAYNTGKITDASQLGFRAIDDSTLEVTLENPAPFILSFMCYATWYPVPQWTIEKHGARWTNPEHIVSNGYFTLETWVPHKEIIVKKSASYWDAEHVQLAGIQYLSIEDKETALKMYEAGEIDINWQLPVAKEPMLQKRSDFVKHPWFTTYFYRINVTKAPYNDPRVRQALALAVDRKILVEQYLHNTQIPYSSLVPMGIPGYTSPSGWDFDPDRAKALLAEAGFGEAKPFPKVTIHYNTEARHKLVAQVIQQMWKANLGIEVELLNEEWKSYLKTQNMLGYEVSRSGWIGDYLDPNTFLEMFTSRSTINQTGWKSAAYDALVMKAAAEPKAEQRLAYLQQAEAILLQEAPIVPLFIETKTMLVRPEVQGFYGNLQDIHPMKGVYLDDAQAKASL